VYGLAEQDPYVYFTTDGPGRVERVLKTSTAAPPELLANTGGAPTGIALQGGWLYWTSQFDGTISRMLPDGGMRQLLASGQPKAADIALDGTSIYFTRYIGPAGDLRVMLDGGTPTTLVSPLFQPLGVVVDETYVYYMLRGAPTAPPGVIGVWRVDKNDPANKEQLTFGEASSSLGIDGNAVYASDESQNAIVRIDKATGVATAIVHDVVPDALAIDETNVYWTDPTRGVVASAPKMGGAVTPLAVGQLLGTSTGTFGPALVMVDDTTVYWLAEASGILWAVPK
jgi:hypothetical protein